MKKTSSMSKNTINFSKSHFGCYFCCRIVNFKNLIVLFTNIGLCMVREKVKGCVVFYSEHIKNDS